MNKKQQLTVSDFLQIPLALVSFLFFYIVKYIMRGLVSFVNNRKKNKKTPWRVISADMVKKPMVLPVFMTKAPRWNPHAIIGVVGPLNVESSIDINTSQANESSGNWGIVMQSLDDGSEKRLSSGVLNSNGVWESLQLSKGHYTAALRYYDNSEKINFPAININGEEAISSMQIDSNTNEFYEELRGRRNLFYVILNYYVYTMLRFSKWLPESFVTNQYLPAADSGMEFKYGVIQKNNELQISLDSLVLSNYEIYITLYDRASFPIQWRQINDTKTTTSPAEETGFYLIRFIRKSGSTKQAIDELSTVNTQYK